MFRYRNEIGLNAIANKLEYKLIARETLSDIFYYSGISKLVDSHIFNKNALIVAYHRVIDPAETFVFPQPGIYVTTNTFEQHMEYLKDNFRVKPLNNIVESIIKGKTFEHKECAITFDDGYLDNFIHAFPVLKKLQLPATVFLTTKFIGTKKCLWFEEVNYLVNYIMNNSDLKKILSNENEFFKTANYEYPRITERIDFIIKKMLDMESKKREKIIEKLKGILNEEEIINWRTMLSWNEVEEMSKYNISFGSHTANHIILKDLEEKEICLELKESFDELAKRPISFLPYLCYPNGIHNETIKKLVAKVGYQAAFGISTKKSFIKPSTDRFAILRICIDMNTTYTKPMYACRLNALL